MPRTILLLLMIRSILSEQIDCYEGIEYYKDGAGFVTNVELKRCEAGEQCVAGKGSFILTTLTTNNKASYVISKFRACYSVESCGQIDATPEDKMYEELLIGTNDKFFKLGSVSADSEGKYTTEMMACCSAPKCNNDDFQPGGFPGLEDISGSASRPININITGLAFFFAILV